MIIRNQLFLLATTLTLLGSIGATPARPLLLSFGHYNIGGAFYIDNRLIESGMREFDLRGDDIDFQFSDTDFLSSTIAMGSVILGDELAQSGSFSFAIRASDIWEDEPWAERYPDTFYYGSFYWRNGNIYSQYFGWFKRPYRAVGIRLPNSGTPDRITHYADWMGIWYSGSHSRRISDFAAGLYYFPTPTPILPPTPAPEPSPIPEPSALLGLFLLGGGCWLKRKLGSR